ncbi:MAG: hypothetical protein JKZ00_04180 [Flavobacteriaceae bacterium]|nr:hypothetical protein [Flavobacteriaceae bacterium]
MIKVFRNIRKKLLGEGKTGMYLKYAIGEIVLVMVGILLALQVNNWNTNRVFLKKEQHYLIGLKNDITFQIAINDVYITTYYNKSLRLNEAILLDYQKVKRFSKIDSINSKLLDMLKVTTINSAKTTYRELMSTGQLNVIQNEVLRKELVAFYQITDITERGIKSNIDNVFYTELFPVIKSSVVIDFKTFNLDSSNVKLDNYPKKLKTIITSRWENPDVELDLVNALALRMVLLNSAKSTLKVLKTQSDQILNLIDKEIKKSSD